MSWDQQHLDHSAGAYRKCSILAFTLDLLKPNLLMSKNSGQFIYLREALICSLQAPVFCTLAFLLTLLYYFICFFFSLLRTTGLYDFSSQTGDWTWAMAVKVPSANHWTSREFLPHQFFDWAYLFPLYLHFLSTSLIYILWSYLKETELLEEDTITWVTGDVCMYVIHVLGNWYCLLSP